MFRDEATALDHDGPAILEPSPPAHEFDVVLRKQGLVESVQLGDVGVALHLESRPVQTREAEMKAVFRRVVRSLGQIGRIPHNLFGNAPDIDAGASEPSRLNDDHAGPVLGRATGTGQSAAAAPDDDQIEFVGHITFRNARAPVWHVTWQRLEGMAISSNPGPDRYNAAVQGMRDSWKILFWAKTVCRRSRGSAPSTSSPEFGSCWSAAARG